jgi:nucleotide-binding universal stress UspA family protein
MRLKDILLHLDGTEQARQRLRLAADLARRHSAHLAALYVIDITLPPLAAGDPSGGTILAGLLDDLRRAALAEAAKMEAEFRERLRVDSLSGEWRQVEGFTAQLVALHARYADLAIVGQENPDGGQPAAGPLIEHALFTAGRPVLIVPYAGRYETIGRKVLIGWNASREAARAVNDALPLMAKADRVTVLSVNPRQGHGAHGDVPGADIAVHLARHDIKVEVQHTVSPEVSDGDILLNSAADLSADLLVIGAYGHSRFRELALGGVTRTLLKTMTLPVLMSH